MNRMRVLIVLMLLSLVSCVEDIRFDRPQPEARPDELALPEKMYGIYRSCQDSSLLYVTPTRIIRYFNRKFTMPRESLDSAYAVRGDSIFYDAENHMWISIEGDLVRGTFRSLDTLFSISGQNVLRHDAGYYFLNREVYPDNWQIALLEYTRGEINLVTTWSEKDLEALRRITHAGDSVHHFKPSRRQMRKFIRERGLPDGEKFVRIVDGESDLEWRLYTGEFPIPMQ